MKKDDQLKELPLITNIDDYLTACGKWAKLLGISGFIGSVFVLIAGEAINSTHLLYFPYGDVYYHYNRLNGRYVMRHHMVFYGGPMWVVYFAVAIISFWVSLKLYRFSENVKRAVYLEDAGLMAAALSDLKTYFRIKGIATICLLSLCVLLIIGLIIIATFMHGAY